MTRGEMPRRGPLGRAVCRLERPQPRPSVWSGHGLGRSKGGSRADGRAAVVQGRPPSGARRGTLPPALMVSAMSTAGMTKPKIVRCALFDAPGVVVIASLVVALEVRKLDGRGGHSFLPSLQFGVTIHVESFIQQPLECGDGFTLSWVNMLNPRVFLCHSCSQLGECTDVASCRPPLA